MEAPEFHIYERKNRSTEGCSKLKSPETRQVQERLFTTLEHLQIITFANELLNFAFKLQVTNYSTHK